MWCDATLHNVRANGPRLAVKIMRVQTPCGCTVKTVALCSLCYMVDNHKIANKQTYCCQHCGNYGRFDQAWAILGDA